MRCLCHSARPVVVVSVFKVLGLETCAYNAMLILSRKRAIWIAVMSPEGVTWYHCSLGPCSLLLLVTCRDSLVVFDIVLCRC
jgi:hypothetical protein